MMNPHLDICPENHVNSNLHSRPFGRSLPLIRFAGVLLAVLLVTGFITSAFSQSLVDIESRSSVAFPDAVDGAVLGSLKGQPVVMGGWAADGDSASWSGTSYVLDSASDSWKRIEGISVRPGSASIPVGDGLVVAGGKADQGWTQDVWLITSSNGETEVTALTPLPESLIRPAGTSVGDKVSVAGFDESGQIVIYQLVQTKKNADWVSVPALTGSPEGELGLAVQNEGLFVMLAPDDGSPLLVWRHTPQAGWEARTSPGEAFSPAATLALGASHIGLFARNSADGQITDFRLHSYSTITDTWSEVSTWKESAISASLIAVGDDVLIARETEQDAVPVINTLKFSVGRRHFNWIDYSTVFAYLLAMILIGLYFSRRESGTDDFFVGGRRMPWWAVGFSLYATGTSAISFMAIPAKSYATDWLYLAQNAIGIIAIIPVAMIIVPLIRRLNITSTYEYLEMRFHTAIRLMGSVLAIVYQMGARMSVVLFLPALALSAVTGIEVVTSILFMGVIATLYTVLGGIKAVIWTDVVQVVVLLGGALLCLVIIITTTDGGLGELLSVATTDSKLHMFDWRADLTIPTVWLFIILATTDTITWPRDQVMVQRVLSTKSSKEAGWSVWTLAAIVIPGSLLFFSLGTALYGFYKVNPERLSPLLDLDATFPFFIAAELPAGVTGLIIAALFAASMSTLDSSMNSVATIIVVDFYKRFKKAVTDEACLRLAKWMTILTGIFGTAFALVLTEYSLPSLWDTFIMLTGLLGGGFGGVYALGMFTRRANWQGALVGIVSSIFITLLVKAYTPIHVLLYAGVAIIACIVIGYIVSLFFPIQEESLEGLTVYMQDNPNGRA